MPATESAVKGETVYPAGNKQEEEEDHLGYGYEYIHLTSLQWWLLSKGTTLEKLHCKWLQEYFNGCIKKTFMQSFYIVCHRLYRKIVGK